MMSGETPYLEVGRIDEDGKEHLSTPYLKQAEEFMEALRHDIAFGNLRTAKESSYETLTTTQKRLIRTLTKLFRSKDFDGYAEEFVRQVNGSTGSLSVEYEKYAGQFFYKLQGKRASSKKERQLLEMVGSVLTRLHPASWDEIDLFYERPHKHLSSVNTYVDTFGPEMLEDFEDAADIVSLASLASFAVFFDRYELFIDLESALVQGIDEASSEDIARTLRLLTPVADEYAELVRKLVKTLEKREEDGFASPLCISMGLTFRKYLKDETLYSLIMAELPFTFLGEEEQILLVRALTDSAMPSKEGEDRTKDFFFIEAFLDALGTQASTRPRVLGELLHFFDANPKRFSIEHVETLLRIAAPSFYMLLPHEKAVYITLLVNTRQEAMVEYGYKVLYELCLEMGRGSTLLDSFTLLRATLQLLATLHVPREMDMREPAKRILDAYVEKHGKKKLRSYRVAESLVRLFGDIDSPEYLQGIARGYRDQVYAQVDHAPAVAPLVPALELLPSMLPERNDILSYLHASFESEAFDVYENLSLGGYRVDYLVQTEQGARAAVFLSDDAHIVEGQYYQRRLRAFEAMGCDVFVRTPQELGTPNGKKALVTKIRRGLRSQHAAISQSIDLMWEDELFEQKLLPCLVKRFQVGLAKLCFSLPHRDPESAAFGHLRFGIGGTDGIAGDSQASTS